MQRSLIVNCVKTKKKYCFEENTGRPEESKPAIFGTVKYRRLLWTECDKPQCFAILRNAVYRSRYEGNMWRSNICYSFPHDVLKKLMVTAVHAFNNRVWFCDSCFWLEIAIHTIKFWNSYALVRICHCSQKYSLRFDREWMLSNTEIEMYHFYCGR